MQSMLLIHGTGELITGGGDAVYVTDTLVVQMAYVLLGMRQAS